MSLLSSIFKARDKPENRTAGSSYAFFMGGTTAGKLVTERSAMQMTAVYSCVRILAEAIAGLPLHLYRYAEVKAWLDTFAEQALREDALTAIDSVAMKMLVDRIIARETSIEVVFKCGVSIEKEYVR